MKKLCFGMAAVLVAASAMAFDAVLPANTTVEQPALKVERIRISTVTINLDAIQHSPSNAAIVVPYQWIDSSSNVTRVGVAKISRADMVATLGSEAASNEVAHLLGLVDVVAKSVVVGR